MPGDPKCPETSMIPKVRYSERKISFETLREWDTFFGCILILHKSGLDCVTMLCLRRSDTTDRDPTFTSPPHRRVVSYVPQPYHSHTMSYVPPMSHLCPTVSHLYHDSSQPADLPFTHTWPFCRGPHEILSPIQYGPDFDTALNACTGMQGKKRNLSGTLGSR